MKKRLISLLLVCLMLVSPLPAVTAAEEDDPAPDDKHYILSPTPVGGVSAREKALMPDLFEGFVRREMGGKGVKGSHEKSSGAGEGLTGTAADMYAAMVPEIHEVAIGKRASAIFECPLTSEGAVIRIMAEDLGFESLIEDGEFRNEFWTIIQSTMLLVYCALKADCPYDLYWHDVATGFQYGFDLDECGHDEDFTWIEIPTMFFGLVVDRDYRGRDVFTVKTSIGSRVKKAADNARAIVQEFTDATDYEKLRGYNQAICSAVTYDDDAYDQLLAGTIDHGDPWQLIWAFDGDPSTNIVCEGYAKAFQHLCDITDFSSDTIQSRIVTGDAGGNHMWNVVRMEDGRTYLMDVTWSDGSGERGDSYEAYFLKGADGGSYPSYQFYSGTRTYDEYTTTYYGRTKLTIADQDYTPGSILIRTQPRSVTVDNGQVAIFTVTAEGEDITYQWYGAAPGSETMEPIEGAVTDTLAVIASTDTDGWRYACALDNGKDQLSTNAVTLTVTFHLPVVKTQPKSVKVKSGAVAKFTVKAADALSYQWYAAPDTPIDHATEATLLLTARMAYNGGRYFCRVQNDDGYVDTDWATLTVTAVPFAIKTQPRSVKVKSGAKVKLSVKAVGAGLEYRWFRNDSPIDGPEACGPEYAFTASMREDGCEYFCEVTDIDGHREVSALARVTVTAVDLIIRTEPKDVTTKSGSKVKFSVKATGAGLTYQWLMDGMEIPGADAQKADYTFTATMRDNGNAYSCRVTDVDGDTVVTRDAILVVTTTPITIKTQPADVSVKAGGTAKFTVKATGPNLKYQWYRKDSAGGGWEEIPKATKATYSVKVIDMMYGWQFKCRVYNLDGEEYTEPATLTLIGMFF